MAVTTDGGILSREAIEEFCAEQRKKGRSPAGVEAYRRNLFRLYDELPEEKRITANTAAEWRSRMVADGVTPRSINTRMSALNSFCDYLGHRELQNHDFVDEPEVALPELTRSEYLRLLSAAKHLEKERIYFIIKTLGGGGLRIQELPQMTVEAVRAGSVEFHYHNNRCQRTVRIPEMLRMELLDYAGREGIKTGPVFCTARGKPVARTHICKMLQQISQTARVDEEKATPRCLWNMYQNTREDILNSIFALADQAYDWMLIKEEGVVGWGA